MYYIKTLIQCMVILFLLSFTNNVKSANAVTTGDSSYVTALEVATGSDVIEICPLGNSITQSNNEHVSYRYPLWKKLIDANIAFDFVGTLNSNHGGDADWPEYNGLTFDKDHEGHWGWRANEIRDNIEGWLAGYIPDMVLIHIGTNDIYHDQQDAIGILSEITQIIEHIRDDNPNVVIFLASLIPCKSGQSLIDDLNARMPGYIETINTNVSSVIFVDMASVVTPEDLFDGIHPGPTGEEKMAQKWVDAINTYLFDETPVTGVSVSPTTASVSVGATTQLTATVAPSNAANKTVTWSSNNSSVATVNASGLVTGVNYGTALITVTTADGGFTAQSSVEVANIPVTGVTVSPSSTTIGIGGTSQLTPAVSPSNATNKSVSWSSNNSSVATVNSSGLVTGVALGSATITVTTSDGGFTATSDVAVSNIVTTTITIQENETGFVSVDGAIDNNNAGFTGDGFANTDNASGEGINWEICVPENGAYSFAWQYANGSTDDRTAQLIVDGSVKVSNVSFPSTSAWTTWGNSSPVNVTLAAGTHQIRLEATNATGLANIDYISIAGNSPQAGACSATNISVTGVSVSPTSASANVGATTQLTATVSPSDATNKSVSWTSSNTSVATVSSSGLVTGLADGSANITVTTADGGFTASCNVSVTEILIPTYELTTSVVGQGTVSPSSGTFNENEQVTLTATPVAGWVFDSWSGDASGSTNPVSITMDGNQSVTANFSETTNPTTLTIQENETGFCSVDGVVDNNNAGFTGDGFANTDNASETGITWSVNIPASGNYDLIWRYANGGTIDRTAQLMVDGSTTVSSISMPFSGSWTSWTESSAVNVNLSAGTKLIRLQATNSSGLSNVDYITISGGSLSAVACAGLKDVAVTADLKNDLSIVYYPVPVDNFLNIEFSKELTESVDVYLFDATGKVVLSDEVNGSSHTLDMSGLPIGLYTVRIIGSDLNTVKHIVKQY